MNEQHPRYRFEATYGGDTVAHGETNRDGLDSGIEAIRRALEGGTPGQVFYMFERVKEDEA